MLPLPKLTITLQYVVKGKIPNQTQFATVLGRQKSQRQTFFPTDLLLLLIKRPDII